MARRPLPAILPPSPSLPGDWRKVPTAVLLAREICGRDVTLEEIRTAAADVRGRLARGEPFTPNWEVR